MAKTGWGFILFHKLLGNGGKRGEPQLSFRHFHTVFGRTLLKKSTYYTKSGHAEGQIWAPKAIRGTVERLRKLRGSLNEVDRSIDFNVSKRVWVAYVYSMSKR